MTHSELNTVVAEYIKDVTAQYQQMMETLTNMYNDNIKLLHQIQQQVLGYSSNDTDNYLATILDNNLSMSNKNKKKDESFIPPTLDEIQKYALSIHNSENIKNLAKTFFDYYSTYDWMIKRKNKLYNMQSWRKALYSWIRNNKHAPIVTEKIIDSTFSESKQESVNITDINDYRADFNKIWNEYPKQLSYEKGFNAFLTVVKLEDFPGVEKIIQIIKSFKTYNYLWKDYQYIPMLHNWLLNKRWTDTIPEDIEKRNVGVNDSVRSEKNLEDETLALSDEDIEIYHLFINAKKIGLKVSDISKRCWAENWADEAIYDKFHKLLEFENQEIEKYEYAKQEYIQKHDGKWLTKISDNVLKKQFGNEIPLYEFPSLYKKDEPLYVSYMTRKFIRHDTTAFRPYTEEQLNLLREKLKQEQTGNN